MANELPFFDDTEIQRVLCVVAHPDDMEYGGSAAVARWTARGIDVAYLLLTAGEAGMRSRPPHEVAEVRRGEQEAACAAVGVDDLTILDFPDGMLEPTLAVREAIARQIRTFRPDVVCTQPWALEVAWGLNHADHRATGIATVDAIRDADNPWVHRSLQQDEGLEPWGAKQLLVFGGQDTQLVDVSGLPLEQAIASLEAHEAYLDELGGLDARGMLEGFTTDGAARGTDPKVTHAIGVEVHQMA